MMFDREELVDRSIVARTNTHRAQTRWSAEQSIADLAIAVSMELAVVFCRTPHEILIAVLTPPVLVVYMAIKVVKVVEVLIAALAIGVTCRVGVVLN